jgi:hypothetical protein
MSWLQCSQHRRNRLGVCAVSNPRAHTFDLRFDIQLGASWWCLLRPGRDTTPFPQDIKAVIGPWKKVDLMNGEMA